MSRQISIATSLQIWSPQACGFISENQEGYARNIGFEDPSKTKDDGTTNPQQDPSVQYLNWLLWNVEYQNSINGINLSTKVIPEDADPSRWTTVSDPLNVLSTTRPIDPWGRVHWYMKAAVRKNGQNQNTQLPSPSTPLPSSASDTVVETTDVSQKSTYQLNDNQGWHYTRRSFEGISADYLDPLLAILETPIGGLFKYVFGDLTVIAEESLVAGQIKATKEFSILHWGIGSASGVEWALMMPMSLLHTNMLLMKSIDGGNTFLVVDQKDFSRGESYNILGIRVHNITFHVENGTAVFSLAGGDEWRYRDPTNPLGFVAPSGYVEHYWAGGPGGYNFSAQGHVVSDEKGNILDPAGVAITTPAYYLPPNINSDPADYHINVYPFDINDPKISPDYTVTGEIKYETDQERLDYGGDAPGAYRIAVSWHPTAAGKSKGAGAVSQPVLLVQEVRKAKVDLATVLLGDLSTDLTRVRWKLNKRYRGNELTIDVRNDGGQWSAISGNELVLFKAAGVYGTDADVVTTGTLIPKCGGFVAKANMKMDASNVAYRDASRNVGNSRGVGRIETSDWELRLKKTPMVDMPAYGGWELQDALEDILNRAGVHPDFYDFDPTSAANIAINAGIGDGWQLPALAKSQTGKGNLNFYYTDQHSSIHAMDELCAAKGFRWGNGPDLVIRAWYVGQFDRSYNYVLDESTFDPETDCIKDIEVERNIENLYNFVRVYTKNENGQTVGYWAWDPDSIYGTYGVTSNYVGYRFTDVYHAPNGMSASDLQAFGQSRLSNLASYSRIIKWTTTGLLSLPVMPRQLVQVNLAGFNMPLDNVFEVISEEGEIEYGHDAHKSSITRMLGVRARQV